MPMGSAQMAGARGWLDWQETAIAELQDEAKIIELDTLPDEIRGQLLARTTELKREAWVAG